MGGHVIVPTRIQHSVGRRKPCLPTLPGCARRSRPAGHTDLQITSPSSLYATESYQDCYHIPPHTYIASQSLFQYGLIPNRDAYFQQGMSLKAEVWVDHCPHGDRHERKRTENGGAITPLSKRYAGGGICAPSSRRSMWRGSPRPTRSTARSRDRPPGA